MCSVTTTTTTTTTNTKPSCGNSHKGDGEGAVVRGPRPRRFKQCLRQPRHLWKDKEVLQQQQQQQQKVGARQQEEHATAALVDGKKSEGKQEPTKKQPPKRLLVWVLVGKTEHPAWMMDDEISEWNEFVSVQWQSTDKWERVASMDVRLERQETSRRSRRNRRQRGSYALDLLGDDWE